MAVNRELADTFAQIEWADKQEPAKYEIRTTFVYQALALARKLGYPSGIRFDEKEGPEWPVVVIDLPGQGEVAWHCKYYDKVWDGHTVEDKYKRIKAYIGDSCS